MALRRDCCDGESLKAAKIHQHGLLLFSNSTTWLQLFLGLKNIHCFSYTYMFKIIKYILILGKDNQSK